MNFKSLVGRTFFENEIYELLLFEIEENFEQYFSKFIHFYFDRVQDKKIKITEITYFEDKEIFNKTRRKIIEKREWFEIEENYGHLNLLLCRFDRSGLTSSVRKNSTRTEEWRLGWADETPDDVPMTPDEIQQAVLELTGIFQDQQLLQKSGSKKAA